MFGCMGKLFTNSGQPSHNGNFQNAPVSPAPDGCMRGCCHGHGWGHGCHGYNAPGSGEPFSGNRNCTGFCNPPKLYADTYNYLNHNLMQPVVKEVYDDLKSITPDNTMMNSPMAAQMGLGLASNSNPMASGAMQRGMGNISPNQMSPGMGNANNISNHTHGPNVRFGNPNMENNMQMGTANTQQQQLGQMAQPMDGAGQHMGGAGQHMGGMGANIVNMMLGDTKPRNFPNQGSSQGGMGNVGALSPQMNMSSNINGHPGQYNSGTSGSPGQFNNNMMQGNPGAQMQNPNQYMSQPNMYAGGNADIQGNPMNRNINQMNPGSQQKGQPMNAHNVYGQHNAGVMQGGDLGFDPMAIAIQMNPANQQRAAMDTMQKMMMSNSGNKLNPSLLQPVINATNAAMTNLTQQPVNQAPNQQNVLPSTAQPGGNVGAVPVYNQQLPQQQVYTALTEDFTPSPEGSPPTRSPPPTMQQMIKEPIFPADTSKNMPPTNPQKLYHYNTLGQPVEMLPADVYRFPEPSLPQTLSPQSITRTDPGRYSNVKSTVSKTSLIGNRPVGRNPSKSQLQHIYNQYKGSQSYTQQNVKSPNNGHSYSDGHLNISKANNNRQAHIERVGGDNVANNNMDANGPASVDVLKPSQVGDIPLSNKPLLKLKRHLQTVQKFETAYKIKPLRRM
ncbi:hypothetical protein HW555_004898 [Spodoptera exigua]|uniref:Uncharacterized protein n=1 Tax=Spodoptera exigua TaxID=7107 RepID=A0A835GLH8_SPOEX|nr:hypothetical protein HW555_004898 [Spodoptera exigua]